MINAAGRMLLGERLREERKRVELSQTAFGEMLGVKKGAQFRYEAGQRSPDADYLMLAALHGVDVHYLLTGARVESVPVFEIRPAEQAAGLPAGREPAGPRVPVPPVRAGWRRFAAAFRAFEASRAADIVDAGVVAFLIYAVFFFAGVLG